MQKFPLKLLWLVIFISACSGNHSPAIIVDKSANKTPSTPSMPAIKATTTIKNIPVRATVKQYFSKKKGKFGVTFNTKAGQNVRSIRKGIVVYSGNKMKSHGKMIIIKHPFGFYSSYTQNQSFKVKNGDTVQKGQVIAITGKKPFYFELKKFSEPINPIPYFK